MNFFWWGPEGSHGFQGNGVGFSRCQQSIMGGPDNRLPIKKKWEKGSL